MPTKIALTGAHGVGKTSLCELVVQKLESQGTAAKTTPEVPRIICDLAEDQTFFRRGKNTILKQTLILLYQINAEAHKLDQDSGIVVCDRALLDHWAYTKYLFDEVLSEEGLIGLYEQFVSDYCRTYSMLFYIPIEFPPVDDGTRESDEGFQKAIDEIIVEFLSKYSLPYITVRGSLVERCNEIVARIASMGLGSLKEGPKSLSPYLRS